MLPVKNTSQAHGDIVLTLGAGNVGGLALTLPEYFSADSVAARKEANSG